MLPIDFTNRMKAILGEEYEKFEASYSEVPVRSFRVNTNKISEENFEKKPDYYYGACCDGCDCRLSEHDRP